MIARRRPTRRGRARPRLARRLLAAAGITLVFALGVALGQALDDRPARSGTQTRVRTLKPLSIPPAARSTVTVTVSGP